MGGCVSVSPRLGCRLAFARSHHDSRPEVTPPGGHTGCRGRHLVRCGAARWRAMVWRLRSRRLRGRRRGQPPTTLCEQHTFGRDVAHRPHRPHSVLTRDHCPNAPPRTHPSNVLRSQLRHRVPAPSKHPPTHTHAHPHPPYVLPIMTSGRPRPCGVLHTHLPQPPSLQRRPCPPPPPHPPSPLPRPS